MKLPHQVSENHIAEQLDRLSRESLPQDQMEKLMQLRARLSEMVLTPLPEAQDEIDDRNRFRQRVWGDRAVWVQLVQGSCTEVYSALLSCLLSDFEAAGIARITIDWVMAPAPGEESEQIKQARQQMNPNLDPSLRRYYEEKLMKHMRKKGRGKGANATVQKLRKLNVQFQFQNQFYPHEIVRVDEDLYFFMSCSNRDW